MIYLASPYSHRSALIRRHRYWDACRAVAGLLRSGQAVFSPIVQGHPLAEHHGLPIEWSWWEKYDREHIARCDEVVVLKLDGWQESVGVTAELKIADQLGKPVRFLSPSSTTLAHAASEIRA